MILTIFLLYFLRINCFYIKSLLCKFISFILCVYMSLLCIYDVFTYKGSPRCPISLKKNND